LIFGNEQAKASHDLCCLLCKINARYEKTGSGEHKKEVATGINAVLMAPNLKKATHLLLKT
jgi:hypothetical protein